LCKRVACSYFQHDGLIALRKVTRNVGGREAGGPQSEWIPIAVERIVDDEIFQMVQDLRLRRDPGRSSGRLPSSPLFLAGLLRCSLCGDTCQLESSGKLDPNGEPYRYSCRRFRSASLRSSIPARSDSSSRFALSR
jgi:hypothetical protein